MNRLCLTKLRLWRAGFMPAALISPVRLRFKASRAHSAGNHQHEYTSGNAVSSSSSTPKELPRSSWRRR